MSVLSNNSFSRFLQRFGTSNDRFVSSPFLGINTLFQPGQETWDNIKGREFDVYETGRLLLPIAKLTPGSYRLVITDPRAEPSSGRTEYSFRIEY